MFIVISGKARVGKDTFANILVEKLDGNYVIRSYADSLKERVMADFKLSWEQVYVKLKEVEDIRYPKGDSYWTPREILQHVGTEAYRAVDANFWINDLFKYFDKNNISNAIIPDGRFPDEIDAVLDRGGVHVRIGREHGVEVHGNDHSSETSLDNYPNIDYIINNNGSIEDLYFHVDQIKKIIKE
jgi:hypothetical protein